MAMRDWAMRALRLAGLVPLVIDSERFLRIDDPLVERGTIWVSTRQAAVKKYIVKLSAEERNRLDVLIQKGKAAARQLLKARILLKADASRPARHGATAGSPRRWTPASTPLPARASNWWRKGSMPRLTRKHSPNSARRRIFDGAAEAKLIALACSPPPKDRKRWTLTLLETAVVELNIVDRASDNTIGRTLKKTLSSLISRSNGSSRRRPTPPS